MGYFVKVYQHPLDLHKGGTSLAVDVTPDGLGGIPADEFEKYGLQDEITVIQYHLPKAAKLVCFTDRFFKNRIDWHLGIKYEWDERSGKGSWSPVFKIPSRGEALTLYGTGRPETLNLHIDAKDFDDKIRSMRIERA